MQERCGIKIVGHPRFYLVIVSGGGPVQSTHPAAAHTPKIHRKSPHQKEFSPHWFVLVLESQTWNLV